MQCSNEFYSISLEAKGWVNPSQGDGIEQFNH